jgi:hypothetical protein
MLIVSIYVLLLEAHFSDYAFWPHFMWLVWVLNVDIAHQSLETAIYILFYGLNNIKSHIAYAYSFV